VRRKRTELRPGRTCKWPIDFQRCPNLIKEKALKFGAKKAYILDVKDEFADKLYIRRSTLFKNLQELRDLGLSIRYSTIRQSYYYADNRRLKITIESIFIEQEVFETSN